MDCGLECNVLMMGVEAAKKRKIERKKERMRESEHGEKKERGREESYIKWSRIIALSLQGPYYEFFRKETITEVEH